MADPQVVESAHPNEISKRRMSNFFHLFIYLSVTTGFAYQYSQISIDYFNYPVTTSVTITIPPNTLFPRIVVCYSVAQPIHGMSISDAFKTINDSIVLTKGTIYENGNSHFFPQNDTYSIKTFLKDGRYCMSIGTTNPISYPSAVELYAGFLGALTFNTRLRNDNTERLVDAQLFMTPYDNDFEGIQLTPVPLLLEEGCDTVNIFTSYTRKIHHLSPPPYETNCRNYSMDKMSSRGNCVSQCLTRYTGQEDSILDSTVISRDKYQNSTLTLISSQDSSKLTQYLRTCQARCQRPDCITETNLLSITTNMGRWEGMDNVRRIINVRFYVSPPEDEVIVVASNVKLSLLDYIVYSFSSLSFWYGFCPLVAADRDKYKLLFHRIRRKLKRSITISQTPRPLSSKVVEVVLPNGLVAITHILIMCGFILQISGTCNEYFRYPTVTNIKVEDFLPTTSAPKVVLKSLYGRGEVGDPVATIFKRYPLNATIVSANIRKDETSLITSGIKVKTYLSRGSYKLMIIPPSTKYTPNDLFTTSGELLSFNLSTNFLKPVPLLYSKLVSIDDDTEGFQMPMTKKYLPSRGNSVELSFTYSVKISKLAPTPYDTDCHDYQQDGFRSNENCLSVCLNDFMANYGMVIKDTKLPPYQVLDKEKYEHSNLQYAPQYLRTMKYFKWEITRKYMSEEVEWCAKAQDRVKSDKSLSKSEKLSQLSKRCKVLQKVFDIFDSYRERWLRCKETCRRPNCLSESLVTKVLAVNPVSQGKPPVIYFIIKVYPPSDQTITVKSKPKLSLLDFLVYISSCLSFWYGFSPIKAKNIEVRRKFSNFINLLQRKLKLSHIEAIQTMNSRKRKTIFNRRLLVYFSVTMGFLYQVYTICFDYFKYPTITVVNLDKALLASTPPTVILAATQGNNLMTGFTVNQAFSSIREKSEILNSTGRTIDGHFKRTKHDIKVGKFFKQEVYNLAFRVRNPSQLTPQYLYHGNTPIYSFSLKSNLLSPSNMKEKNIKLSMTPYDSDMEGIQKSPLSLDCPNLFKETCRVYLTYAIRVTNHAPTPYDTDCKDYRNVCYERPDRTCVSSKESCLSDCLHLFTEQHAMVIESSVLWKNVYEKSSHTILPWYFRTMSKSHNEVNMSVVREDLRKLIRNDSLWNGLVSRISNMFPEYKLHWKMCNDFCRRPDCRQESLVPKVLLTTSIKNSSSNLLDIQVYPSDDQVITVTSTPKHQVLEFVVYVCSCLSFWFALCPLQLLGMTRSFNSKTKKKRQPIKMKHSYSKVAPKITVATIQTQELPDVIN